MRPLGVAALVAGLALAVLEWAVSPHTHALVFIGDVVAGFAFLIGCAVTTGAMPPTRMPILFLATGVTWFIGPALGPWQGLYVFPLVALLVAYPTGHIRGSAQRTIVVAALLSVFLSTVASLPAVVPALLLATAVVAFTNGIRTPGSLRRGRRSAASAAVVMSVVMAASGEAAAQGWITPDVARILTSLTVATSALWIAADLRWGGWVNDALTRLVIELGDAQATSLRDMLRVALGDDDLVLGYALEGGASFVDEHGEAIVLPDPSSGLRTVPLISGGERVGMLITSAPGDTEASLAEGVAAAAALAIGNARLYAAIHRQVADVSASRRRLVEAVESQRARLQDDVDNQIAPKLAAVARAIPETIGPEAERLRAGVAAIDAQLRGLASGVGPTDVAIHGLPQAIRSLADQCPLSVDVEVDAPGIDADAAATAFFIAAEGLANASKHAQAGRAWIDIRRSGDELVVDIRDDGRGGAVVTPGSGLDGLGDRLHAREGTLEIGTSNEGGVRLIARLPVRQRAQRDTITGLAPTA